MPIIVTASGSTGQTVIDRALRLIGQLEAGESASGSELADAIIALNAMLDQWRNERLMVVATQDEVLALTASTTVYTIGPSGTLVTTRPLSIESAFIVASNITYDVQVIDNDEYDQLQFKVSSANWPDRLNYTPTMPNGTIEVYPVPNGVYLLHLRTRIPLASVASASDSLALPPGWDDAIAFNLAVRLAPEYEKEPSPTVVNTARFTKQALKVMNSPKVKASNEIAFAFAKHRSRIISDT